jgi:hypothetical protein
MNSGRTENLKFGDRTYFVEKTLEGGLDIYKINADARMAELEVMRDKIFADLTAYVELLPEVAGLQKGPKKAVLEGFKNVINNEIKVEIKSRDVISKRTLIESAVALVSSFSWYGACEAIFEKQVGPVLLFIFEIVPPILALIAYIQIRIHNAKREARTWLNNTLKKLIEDAEKKMDADVQKT